MDSLYFNIGNQLEKIADNIPKVPAIIMLRNKVKQTGFLELHRETNRLASGLAQSGVSQGHRVLLMVHPSLEFIALTYALFRIGAVPILIDPGLSRKSILGCVKAAEPDGMIAIPLAHAARILLSKPFETIQTFITVGKRWFWGGKTLAQIKAIGNEDFEPAKTTPEDPAAILFTSGSTGPPKGVVYTHKMFSRQTDVLRTFFGFKKGEVDLITFPLFSLFSVALGLTCVIPDINHTRPAKVSPKRIIDAVNHFNVTTSFGSPALWDTVSRYCVDHDIQLPTLKRILMAGAPVPGNLLKQFDSILKGGEIFTPYGATEALPVTSISRSEILTETWEKTQQGSGVCVGQAIKGVEIKIIKITENPIPNWFEELTLDRREIGEIVVKSPWVTRQYFKRENATEAAKIWHGKSFWHRMGDVGYLDEKDRLWFCGRKSHRVITPDQTFYTIPCEAVFNNHPVVKRSALVGVGTQSVPKPVIIIETLNGKIPSPGKVRDQLVKELIELANSNPMTRNIKELLFHPSFPVDVRHNAKIFREKLALWAEEQLNH